MARYAIDPDEEYPVYSLIEDGQFRSCPTVELPPCVVARYEAAAAEWRAVQADLGAIYWAAEDTHDEPRDVAVARAVEQAAANARAACPRG